MKELFVVDAVNYLFRCYYAIRKMTNHKGISTNALFGFIRSIQKLQKDFPTENLVCVFDGPQNKRSRLSIYKEYKGHRTQKPEDLYPQIDQAILYCEYAGIPVLQIEGVEADDTMGSIAHFAKTHKLKCFLCSSDKDLCQLVDDHIFVLNTFKDNLIIDAKKVEDIYGIRPDQIIDYLAIMGDTSDNIPGVQGMGPKTAQSLLNQYDSLDTLLKHPEKIENAKQREKIILERENALISKELATIQTNVSIPHNLDFYKLKSPHHEQLINFFQEMNFNSLLKELDTESHIHPSKSKVDDTKTTVHIIETEEELSSLLKKLSSYSECVVDTETDSLDPEQANIVGIGLGVSKGEAYYIPFHHKLKESTLLKHLTPFFEETKRSFIGHNIKYDMHALKNAHISLASIAFDTMIASYLLNSNLNRHNLDDLVLETFNHVKIPIESLIGKKGKHQLSMKDAPLNKIAAYCAEDVDYTFRLKEMFETRLKEEGLFQLFQKIEIPLIQVLFHMERRGIFFDAPHAKILSQELHRQLKTLEQEISSYTDEPININSPKQLSHLLFEVLQIKKVGKKTQTGYSTSQDVLELLIDEHPIISAIIEYRLVDKLTSTFLDSLLEKINPQTKRIHCSFNQSVTATGRLSSTDPNLQNIPIRTPLGKKIREIFRPEKSGWKFVGADYSQIELRLLAHFSGDENLTKAFVQDKDIHRATAALTFGVNIDEVTDEMRSKAKAVNFGIIYGQGAFGLSKQLGIDMREANHIIETYFHRYPKVKHFLENCKKEARELGFSTTLFGRKRLLPEIKSKNAIHRAQAERFAVNAPIQGTQADIIKLAMLEIEKELLAGDFEGYMILQIHDELIFECPGKETEALASLVKRIMENACPLNVPLKVDISVGNNWGEC